MNAKQWEKLFEKEVLIPVTKWSMIPFGILALIGVVISKWYFNKSMILLVVAMVWSMCVIVIYGMPAGLDFQCKYGIKPNK